MRICFLVSGDLWAGAEVMVFTLLKRLRDFPDLELSVLVFSDKRLAAELKALGLPVTVLDEGSWSPSSLFLKTRAFLRALAPHVIHSHRYKENILAYLAGGARGDARLVATLHGLSEPHYRRKKATARFVSALNTYLLTRHFDKLVGVSSSVRDDLLQRGARPDKLTVISNGIEVPSVSVRRGDVGKVIGSAGRLYPVKDYPLMVAIAAKVVAAAPTVRFELAGDGPEGPQLKELVADLKLADKFRFRGAVEEMEAFYQGLDIYLNTSLHEGIPMSILEAMAHGLPVVAPDVGGIGEIIDDGVEGFLVRSRNPADFAEKCLLLQDSALRQRMGLAAREKVERAFSAEQMARQYRQLYLDLAGG